KLLQIKALANQLYYEPSQVIPRYVVLHTRRQKLHIIDLPRAKLLAHRIPTNQTFRPLKRAILRQAPRRETRQSRRGHLIASACSTESKPRSAAVPLTSAGPSDRRARGRSSMS